jgi:MFS family permease
MTAFVRVWAGQLISQLGSAMSAFAIAVWSFGRTASIGNLSLLAIAVYVPQIALAPYGGILADRRDRRGVMLATDAGAAITSFVLLGCAWFDKLPVAVAIVLVAAGSACNALQWPAFESATVTLVPTVALDRANGMLELSRGAAQLLAPILGGALLGSFGLTGILLVDVATFGIGIAATLSAHIPPHRDRPGRPRGLGEAWRVIGDRSGLVAMLLLFAATSFTFAVVDVALKPIVLGFGEPWRLGAVLSTVGVGMVAGSVALAAWNGTYRRIGAILAFQLVEGGSLVIAGSHPTFRVLCVAGFAYGVVIPLTFGCARTIWQLAIPAPLQGRVAALRNAVVTIAIPIGYAAATPLAAVLALPVLVLAMGVVTWFAAIATFAFRPYRDLDHLCLERAG